MNIVLAAARLAAHYHRDQKRKHNGRPFVTHPVRVGGRAATQPELTEAEVAGAFLHDTIEDQGDKPERYMEIKGAIIAQCGTETWNVVLDLTNKSKGFPTLPRAERKNMDRRHIKGLSRNVKIIKLIDLIDNINECITDVSLGVDTSLSFNLTYAEESQLLLNEALRGTDTELEAELLEAIYKLRERCACAFTLKP